MDKKKTFIIYTDQLEAVFPELDIYQRGLLFTALFNHVTGNDEALEDMTVRIAFKVMASSMDINRAKYDETCARRAEYGRNGGLAKASKAKQKLSDSSKSKQTLHDTDTVTDTDIDTDTVIDMYIGAEAPRKNKTTRFVKPSAEEIAEYIKERGSNVDADKFFDYYEANGWKVGRSSMKDWRAALRIWERNESSKKEKTLDEILEEALADFED